MEQLIFLAAYILFVFVQAIFINGIRISAVGETETLPDGSERDSEMILYPLYKFFTQKTYKRIYYSKDMLSDLLIKLKTLNPILNGTTDITREEYSIFVTNLKFIDSEIKTTFTNNAVSFYKEVEFYKFSKYIRKPIIQCIICMASFWGLFTYWPIISYLYGVNIFTIILWVINTICLSYVNYLVYKKH